MSIDEKAIDKDDDEKEGDIRRIESGCVTPFLSVVSYTLRCILSSGWDQWKGKWDTSSDFFSQKEENRAGE